MMDNNKYAVIDLGSNTFHLLIVKAVDDQKISILYKKRVFTALSDGGVQHIKPKRFADGLNTLKEFRSTLDLHENPPLRVIGTAVLRQADNRNEFIQQASVILNSKIEIIDGQQEANYIYEGITLLDELHHGHHLIMDIGGGSTEFIIVDHGQKMWSESFPLGVGILHELFHKTDPIRRDELMELRSYVLQTIKPLLSNIAGYQFDSLTGASGSFEVLQSISGKKIMDNHISTISIDDFEKLYFKIMHSTEFERRHLPGLPKERAKLIVVGMALKDVIIEIAKPSQIYVSPYALKEGVLKEMIQNVR